MSRTPLLWIALWLAGAGAHAAAAAPAAVAFDGDVAFGASGVLELEVGGEAPGSEHDQVNVAGQVSLDGALALLPLGAFGTAPGAQATLLTWGARSGEFASVSGVQQAGGIDLAVTYGAGALDVSTRVRGDVDGDGELTAGDTALVEAAATAGLVTTDYGAGDVDGSGLVDAQDVAIVEDALANAEPAPVPALGGAARLALALSLLGLAGRARRLRERSTR